MALKLIVNEPLVVPLSQADVVIRGIYDVAISGLAGQEVCAKILQDPIL